MAAGLGALGPDVKLDQVPKDVFLCLKFAVLQRSTSCKFEVRACADAGSRPAGNRYNDLWVPPEKVTMSDSETVLAELALAARLHGKEVQGCKRDLRKAYWQVPRSQVMFALVSCSVETSVRQAQFEAATVSSKLLSSFCSTSFCCQCTTTLMTTGCSLLRGQCNQQALCWIEQLRFWAIIGRRKSTIQLCRFPCWVCPLKLSTAKRFARTRKNENRALSESLSLSSLRHQITSTLVPLLASLSLQARVCADELESTLDGRYTRL